MYICSSDWLELIEPVYKLMLPPLKKKKKKKNSK